jgi:hypothetical protein
VLIAEVLAERESFPTPADQPDESRRQDKKKNLLRRFDGIEDIASWAEDHILTPGNIFKISDFSFRMALT